MTTIDTTELEQGMKTLLLRIEQGEEFVIARNGRPIGTLRPLPIERPLSIQTKPVPFQFGLLAGKGTIPDDIKTPYEAEINDMFYGE